MACHEGDLADVVPRRRHNDIGEEVAALRQLLLDDGWALGDGRELFEAAVAAAEVRPAGVG